MFRWYPSAASSYSSYNQNLSSQNLPPQHQHSKAKSLLSGLKNSDEIVVFIQSLKDIYGGIDDLCLLANNIKEDFMYKRNNLFDNLIKSEKIKELNVLLQSFRYFLDEKII